jgi:hypothetical protein
VFDRLTWLEDRVLLDDLAGALLSGASNSAAT